MTNFGFIGLGGRGQSKLRELISVDGVKVTAVGESLHLELHIIVNYGVNLHAISQSIISEVKYAVEKKTGFHVSRVNVCVDGMTVDGEKKK